MSFDRLAPHYRWLERVLAGGKLQRCRLAWLSAVADARHGLVVGEGPGRFLEVCARRLPNTRWTCVDASAAMLHRAESSWCAAGGAASTAEFIHASLPAWQPAPARYDLIVTHFFLDCFPEPTQSQVIATLAAGAGSNARWLLADFCVPERGWSRRRAQLILALAYGCFRVVTKLPARALVSPDAALLRHGFRRDRQTTYDLGLLHSSVWVREPTPR